MISRKIFAALFSASLLCGCQHSAVQTHRNGEKTVFEIYGRAWQRPAENPGTEIDVRAMVVIAKDGTVVSADIVKLSGDLALDRSVRRTLNDVHRVIPFATGTTNDQQAFYLDFKLKPRA